MDSENLERVSQKLKGSERIVVLTGAGISQESGVPTFRGTDGLWKNYQAEELATPDAFKKDPVLVWEWYNWRRTLIKPLQPNPGHYALVDLEKRTKAFTLVTQNVDGLHAMAGSRDPIEMHGTLWRVRCIECGKTTENRQTPIEIPPRCPDCRGLLRPDVVWFGEPIDTQILSSVFEALERAQVMMVVGTSGVVQPAASFGLLAKKAGAAVMEVNRSRTAQSPFFDFSFQGKAGKILPQLVKGVVS